MLRRWPAVGCALAALSPLAASASTLVECAEGADFIANAAASRDNELSREAFLDRLEGGFLAIRAFPAALRWFVKSPEDERFPRAAAEDVFDHPRLPDRHRTASLSACLSRATA
jgi:hypothetical protein